MIKIRTRVDQKKIKKAVAQSFRDYDKKKNAICQYNY